METVVKQTEILVRQLVTCRYRREKRFSWRVEESLAYRWYINATGMGEAFGGRGLESEERRA